MGSVLSRLYCSDVSLRRRPFFMGPAVPVYARVHSFTRKARSLSSLSSLAQSLQRLDLGSSIPRISPATPSQKSNFSNHTRVKLNTQKNKDRQDAFRNQHLGAGHPCS